eukprot:13098096-Heterocapsa_arctica.AAC.1
MKCDIITLQETRLFGTDQLGRARAWANKANLLFYFRAAVKTGPGILGTSAGVAVGARSCIPTKPFKNEELFGHGGILVAVHVEGLLPGGFTIMSVYMKDGIGLAGINLDIMESIGRFTMLLNTPWILAGDWNMEPDIIRAAGWLHQFGGE